MVNPLDFHSASPDEDTAQALAKLIQFSRESGITDIQLSRAIVAISSKVYTKALEDRVEEIVCNSQPFA